MRIAIRLAPKGDGRWHWSLGRGGKEATYGDAESYEAAQKEAETAAQRYAQEAGRAQSYLYDTATEIRIPIGEE